MNTKTIRKIVTTLLAMLSLSIVICGKANAAQHKQIINGKQVIVHTSPIPVILHRLVPPQYGRHVTQREVSTGHVPQKRVVASNRKRP